MQALTRSTASSELIVADGELAPDLASTTRTTFPTPTTPTHSPFPHRPRRRRGHYPRSTLAVTRGRNFVDVDIISRSFRRPASHAATQAFYVLSAAPLLSSTLKPTSAHLCVRAPSALSRNDVGTLCPPPTTILDDLALVTVAAAPPMRSTRDSQAEEITLDTTARPSHEGSRPSSATRNDPRVGYRRPSYEASNLSQTTAEGHRPVDRVLYDPERPEARIFSPILDRRRRAWGYEAKFCRPQTAGGQRVLPRRRMRQGWGPLPPRYEHFSLTPNRRRHARAPSAKDAAGVGYPWLPFI
ncbi:hypothetical protein EV121DRAFT_297756 [Schizophyllum commune]